MKNDWMNKGFDDEVFESPPSSFDAEMQIIQQIEMDVERGWAMRRAKKESNLVFFKPTIKAKGRTKNRLREHGKEGFVVIGRQASVVCMDGRPAIMLASRPSNEKECWTGWLAEDEVEELTE